MRTLRSASVLAIVSTLIFSSICFAAPPVLISQNVDESKLVTLAGNTRPEANKENDRGLVADDFLMEHMFLQLKRSPAQEQQLQQFVAQQEDKSSPNFHHWLSAKEFGKRFGLAKQDLDTITRWLESHGFKVNVVYQNGLLIDFSGTAGQVRAAFHTGIHELDVKGEKHIANMSDPKIPAALAPAVVGIVSLHDFKPHAMYKPRANYSFAGCGGECYVVGAGDLATIYNLNPLFTAGISGQGQTIVVVEDTDVFATADWTTFRSTFGLSSFTGGSFTQVHPSGSGTNNCSDPGVNGDDIEATLDAEYASAAAPSAAIVLASCSDTATFGGLIAIHNLLTESNPPAIISMSYGECEAFNGATSNAAFNSAFQQAVTEGVSVFVSSGDDAASGCDRDATDATHGIGVSGWASTPYNVAVGGTDFGDTYAGTNTTYWSATNSSTYESALSYVPEIPWNDSCASVLIANYITGSTQTYGASGFCNSTTAADNGLLNTVGGSGGPSGCATGSPSVSGVVGGTCAGWPKPTWQSLVVGNPSDTVRDLPDVSLFAANALWSHYYPFCFSDTSNGGTPCTGTPDTWNGAGGTSFSSPIMAGIQALVNQNVGGPQGNPNPVYYQLAANEYGASGDNTCNSTLGNTVGSSCIFYDVTQGDMDVNCTGTNNCYLDSASIGVLSTSNSSYQPAYGTTTGWDFATGIGTVNAYNLVKAYAAALVNFSIAVTATPNSTVINQSVTWNGALTAVNGYSNNVNLSCTTGAPSTCTISPSSLVPTAGGAPFTVTLGNATVGTFNFTISATDGTLIHATSTETLTVGTDVNWTDTPPTSVTVKAGQSASYSFSGAPVGASNFTGPVTLACTGLPALTSCVFNPTSIPATSGTTSVTLTITTTGPNPNSASHRKRISENRSPWLPLSLPLAGVVMLGFAGRRFSKYSLGVSLCLALALVGFMVACGGSSTPPISVTGVSGTPNSVFPNSSGWVNQTAQFTATVNNDSSSKGVTWSISGSAATSGTIDPSSGLYTAPTLGPGIPATVTITATSVSDPSKSGSTSETLNVPTALGTTSISVTATAAGGPAYALPVSLTVQ